MRRAIAALTALLAVAMLLGGSALAGIEWCAEDPAVRVLGSTFDLTTSVQTSAASVDGITYVLDVPSNAGKVQVSYPGGRSIPTTVQVTYGQPAYSGTGPFHVVASITVTGPDDTAVVTRLGGSSVTSQTVSGETGQTLVLGFDVTGN